MPCIPGIPRFSTCSVDIAPMPSSVVITGICAFLGQLPQLVPRPRDQHAVAGQDHRPLRLVDQMGGGPHLSRVGVARRDVAGQVNLVRPLELDLLAGQHVLRHVNQDGAGPAGARDVKGFLDGRRDVAHVHHQVVVLGDRQGDAR